MLLMLVATSVIVSSCDKEDDDDDDENPQTSTVVLQGEYTTDRQLSSDTIYEMRGYVVFTGGATLSIDPGTIIKAATGTGTDATVLVIARGSKIEAIGNANNPIIFTSTEDNIALGQKFGTNLGKDDISLWGGVIILGSAKISAQDGDTETQIEGLPANSIFGLYGGNNDADDSGELRYVSIRHTGTSIAPDNELQGLTMGGVGNTTQINYIESYASFDDGIEIFGGSVNVNHLVVAYANDDAVDLDMSYSGTIDNFYVIHEGGSAGNSGFEFDGPEGTSNRGGKYTVTNGTVKKVGGNGRAATLKSASQGTINNCAFIGFSEWVTVEGGDANSNYLAGDLEITNCQFVTSALTGVVVSNGSTTDSLAIEALFVLPAAGNTAVTTPTVGATINAFSGWTLAGEQGLID